MYPEVNEIYTATVTDDTKFGLKARLNGFTKNYEGLIYKAEVTGKLAELIVGEFVKVKVVSFAADGFISITTRNIQQPITQRRINMDVDKVYEERKRGIRVASPGRREVSQFTELSSEVEVIVQNEEPPFLKRITTGLIPTKIPKEIKIFRDQNGFMARVAKRSLNAAKSAFYFSESGFDSYWHRPEHVIDSLKDLNLLPQSSQRNSCPVEYKQRAKMSIREQRESLPIFHHRNEIIKAVTDNQVLIVIAETGSGKTTQIPQYLVESGFVLKGKIACTQPRRVAAVSVAKRVAEEYGCILGQDVGYKIRFDDQTSPSTVIKYMTDGILLRECMSEPNMDNYSVIMLDEAHERTRDTDVMFGLLKEAVKRRNSLRVIISSATLNASKFSSFFDNAKILTITGSMYPVETFYYRTPTEEYFNLALSTVLNIHLREPDGDILLFLTGQEEIERACDTLEEYMNTNRSRFALDLVVLPMFSALPSEMQGDVLAPTPKGKRKLIIATNIAEASITIDGVKFVVDPGYCKQKINDPKTSMDALQIVPISQASANQRLGRAGRTAPGKCYRLYTERAFNTELLQETVPEIQRSDLSSVILYLKAIGIKDILNFDFMNPPQKDNIISSLKQLYILGALNDQGEITDLGRQMTQLPIDPNLAKMMIFSVVMKCTDEIATIVAMLSVGNVFYRPRKLRTQADEKKRQFDQAAGDHFRLLNVFQKYEKNFGSSDWCKQNFLNEKKLLEAQDIRKNLIYLMDKQHYELFSAGYNYERVQMAITSGFYQNIAKRQNGFGILKNKSYVTLLGTQAFIHPASSIFHQLPQWIVYNNMTETSKNYLNESTVINPRWLEKLFPQCYKIQSSNNLAGFFDL